jgi:hypothetical protein
MPNHLVPIFDLQGAPVRGMRSAQHPALLGEGEYQLIQNLRWDRGHLQVRPGCAQVLGSPAVGATPFQMWSGVLNGTPYVVGAFVVGAKIRLYYKSGPNWIEVTQSSGWCGDSRFPTVGTTLRMAQFRGARGSSGAGTFAAKDLLIVQNGEDYPRVWDPAQNTSVAPGLSVHRPITMPNQAEQFRQVATCRAFWPMTVSGGRTFPTTGGANPTAYRFVNSTLTYTGANAVPEYSLGAAAAAGQVAAIQFTASRTFSGEQLLMVLEGADAPSILSQAKIEISPDSPFNPSGTWHTVYDPTSTLAYLRESIQVALDPAGSRYVFAFRISHLTASQRTAACIRFTRQGAAPGVAQAARILMIASSGTVEGGSLWGVAYSNRYSGAESPGLVAFSSGTEKIANLGAPNQAAASLLALPVDPRILYDYNLFVRNSDAAGPISGDIGGEPTDADLYLQRPGSNEFYYAFSNELFKPNATPGVWDKQDSNPITVINSGTAVGGFTRTQLDTQRTLPGPFTVAIPAARDVLWANNRLFVFGVKEPGGTYSLGDLYFSEENRGFRMQSIVDDDRRGGRLLISGEKGQRLIATAASAQGAAYVYAFTDSGLYSLGGAGAFAGSGFSAPELSRIVRMLPHGTNSSESVVEHLGALFWVDQDLVVRRFEGGQLMDLSRLHVDDRMQATPDEVRRRQLAGCFHRNRYYLGYTPAGGSANTRILIWNDLLSAWEADDALPSIPSTVSAERICRFYDSTGSGSGQRIFLLSTDGLTYEYEVGTTDPSGQSIAWALRSREVASPSAGQPFIVDSVYLLTDPNVDVWNADRYYRVPACAYRTQIVTTAGWVSDASKAHSPLVAEADGKGERGCAAYLNLSGTSVGGTKILRVTLGCELLLNEEAVSA